MPKIRTRNTKAPPEGFDEIEPTLLEFAQRLKDGTSPARIFL
jgi:bud site selection protein 31